MRKGETKPFNPTTNFSQMGSQALPRSMGSQKRKGSPQVKFYAVKAGHVPGIYLNWKECERNISGFRGASFKSFPTREEADAYVAGLETSPKSTQPSSQVEKFYGVAKGRIPGVYTEWATAQEQITGWKFPKYKKFATRAEAEEFVRNDGSAGANPALSKFSDGMDKSDRKRGYDEVDGDVSIITDAKRFKNSITGIENSNKLRSQTSSGVERDILDPVSPRDITKATPTEVIRIHTDGSSLGNGQYGARAGLGVYFGSEDPRNIAERLPGMPQTNQRAELAAILRALEISPTNREVHIVTDSKYSIECVTAWYKNWERNDWQTSLKQPVINKDLIQAVLNRVRAREALGAPTRFFWIKGHSKNPGNEAADRLAVLGAQKPNTD